MPMLDSQVHVEGGGLVAESQVGVVGGAVSVQLSGKSSCKDMVVPWCHSWLGVLKKIPQLSMPCNATCQCNVFLLPQHLSNWQTKTLSEAAWSAASSKCCWNECGWQSGWWRGRRGLAIVLNPLGKKYTNARHMNLSWVGKEILKELMQQ